MQLLLMAAGVYLGVMAIVWIISTAFASGGILGVFGLVALVILGLCIASAIYKEKK